MLSVSIHTCRLLYTHFIKIIVNSSSGFSIAEGIHYYKWSTLPIFLGQLISAYEGIGCVSFNLCNGFNNIHTVVLLNSRIIVQHFSWLAKMCTGNNDDAFLVTCRCFCCRFYQLRAVWKATDGHFHTCCVEVCTWCFVFLQRLVPLVI